ncbi:MAG: hypothetical protein KJ634_01340 [Gammaproteobacteria bacterium]|nr:hypothetical protein [Gammaproteobacteria bacterium]MBU1414242.1 hypothetical protein [Gammaproteobacteria bacterium]
MNKTDVRNDEVATANTGDPAVAAQAAMGGALPQTSAERELLAPKKHAVRHKKEDEDEQAASAARSDDAGLVADADIDNPDASPFAAATAGDEPLIFADAAAAGGTATDAAAGGSAAGGAAAGGAAAGGAAAAGGVGVGAYIGGGLLLAAAAGGGGGGGGGGGDGDTTAPVAPTVTLTSDTGASATDLITNNGALTLGGVEAGATVEYSTDGTTWTTTFTAAAGENTVYVRQTDAAGNVGAASAAFTFTLDTTASTISVVAPDNTNDSTPTISGTTNAAEGSTVTITVSQSGSADQTLTATVQADGSYSANVTTALADGAYTAAASVTDTAGNTGTANDSGSVDTSAPSVTVNAPDITNDNTPAISGTTDAPVGNTVTITISQGATEVDSFTTTVQSGGTFSVSPTSALPDGDYTVEASVAGSTGTVGTGTDSNFTVDTTLANTTVALTSDTGSSNSDLITSSAALTFNTAAGDVTRSYTVDGGASSGTYTAPTTDGSHTVVVTDTDTAGNTDNASITFTLDTTLANTTVALTSDAGSSNSDLITNSAALTFNTAAGDVTRSYVVDGGAPSGTYTAPTTDGSHTVVVTDTDTAGNTDNASITFTLDTTLANTTVALTTDSTDGGTGHNTDLVSSSAALTFNTAAGDVTRSYTVDGGASSGTYTAPTTDGSHTVVVTDTDTAGNTDSATITFTLDTDAPDALNDTNPASDGNFEDPSTESVRVSSTQEGIAYLINDDPLDPTNPGVAVTDLASITGAADNLQNSIEMRWDYDARDLALAGLANGTYHLYTVDVAGNLSAQSADAITIGDVTAPVFAGGATASVSIVENISVQTSNTYGTYDARIYDPSADGNVGVTYTIVGGADQALFQITDPGIDQYGEYGTPGAVLYPSGLAFNQLVGFNGGTEGSGTDNSYEVIIQAEDANGNTSTQTVTVNVTDDGFGDTGELPETVDLGAAGQLINPFDVGGHTYYFWDITADGDIRGGMPSGSGDSPTHTYLDGIFLYDAGGGLNADAVNGTTDTYRYATLNSNEVALPTYQELQDIWTALGSDMPGYASYEYWSATRAPEGEYFGNFGAVNLGDTAGTGDPYYAVPGDGYFFVLLEYIPPVA